MKNGDFLSTSFADDVFLLFSTAITTGPAPQRQMHSDKSNDSLSLSLPFFVLNSVPHSHTYIHMLAEQLSI